MIYINQEGAAELGRGETLEVAIIDAREHGFEIDPSEIKRASEARMDGDVYWTDDPMPGYNGVSHYEIELRNDLGDRLFWNTDGFSDDARRDRDTFDTRSDAEWELRNQLRETSFVYTGWIIEVYCDDTPDVEIKIGEGQLK